MEYHIHLINIGDRVLPLAINANKTGIDYLLYIILGIVF